jgi:hypothetical protein
VTHLTETATGWSDPRHRSYLQRHGFDRRLGTARLREDKVKRPETPLRARPLIGHTNELGHAVATRFAGSPATLGPGTRSTITGRTCSAVAGRSIRKRGFSKAITALVDDTSAHPPIDINIGILGRRRAKKEPDYPLTITVGIKGGD